MTTLLRKALFLVAIVYAQVAAAQAYDEGMAAMQLEDWDKAITFYSAASKANPADQSAFLTLGNAYLAKGDKAKAAENFQAAFNAKPDGPLALVSNGRLLLLKDDDTGASQQFEKAKKNAKKDVSAVRQIGESYFFYTAPGSKRPNLTRAEQWLKMAMDMNSKDFPTLMSLGYCYKEIPRGGDAALHYEFAENIEPKNPLPKLMIAKVYKAAKISDKFLTNVNKAIAVAPNFSPALREKALFLYLDRKWEDATQAYKDLVNNGADVKIEDEMQLANCLYITHDCKGCSELVEKILKKDPSKNYLRRLQAYCDFDNGEYQRGLDILRSYFKSVTPDKILPSDYEYLGKLLLKSKGDTLEAISSYKKAVAMDSSLWKYYKEIGDLQYTRKDNCSSAMAFQIYFDSVPKPDPAELYKYGLAQYYCKDDTLRYQKAMATFLKITELVPTAGIGWLWSGKAAAKQDPDVEKEPEKISEFGKAQPYFEKYVEIGSLDKVKNKKDLVAAYEYLTYYYYNKGDAAKVKENAAKLLEIDPTNKTGTELMKAAENGLTPVTPNTPTPPNTPVPPPNGGGGGGKG